MVNVSDDGEGVDAPAGVAYAEAMRELDLIVRELEADDVDIDLVAGYVKRAGELIVACRGRIESARVEIERLTESLG